MSDRMKVRLMLQPVPIYSKGEEVFNWVSHLIGIVIGFFALNMFITLGIIRDYPLIESASLIIYSLSIMVLYTCSMVYHLVDPETPEKRVWRLIDHNTIYFLIAGTYAPICAIAMQGTSWGIIMMAIEGAGLLIGTILNFININNKFIKVFTVILYVVMGWLVLFCFPAIQMLDLTTMSLILSGGIAYTVGVIFYAVGKQKKWMHSVFHLFVLAGTILQLIGICTMINLF